MKLNRKDFLRLAAGSLVVAGSAGLARAIGRQEPGAVASPEPAVRLGMAIDLARCRQAADCDKCSRACHRTHNVPAIPDPKQVIKWLWKEPAAKVFPALEESYQQQNFAEPLPVLCNHCAKPQCVRVCPTQATWKRADGVVMMDYHRCIGCRYCMAACPYGSRSFNFIDPRPFLEEVNAEFPTRTKGVVEKCNFCEERLVEGKLPACVAACPEGALVFGDLNDEQSAIRELLGRRFALQRRPELGCGPSVFYLI